MRPFLQGLRSLGNIIGVAWWAKVDTNNPSVTYWFGPFLTKKSLTDNLDVFIDELLTEGSQDICHSLVRGRRGEPLTN